MDIAIIVDGKEDTSRIKQVCETKGYTVHSFDDFNSVDNHLWESATIIFHSAHLKTLEFKTEAHKIVLADLETSDAVNIFRHNPKELLIRPVRRSEVSMAISKVRHEICDTCNYAARSLNFYNSLNRFYHDLESLRRDKKNKCSLDEMISGYCRECCPNALIGCSFDPKVHTEHQLIHVMANRGSVYCDKVEHCRLLNFKSDLETENSELLNECPHNIIDQEIPEAHTLKNVLELYLKLYHDHILEIEQTKRRFCTERCPQIHKDNEIKQGDKLISSPQDTLKGKIAYCNDHQCPLDTFFDVFMLHSG